ncbi:hypothetical protein BDV38DRAFT_197697 [Aspergillus pseudotamarii]|uniref:Uncharacterized protein n=1 Tax=Aspergillus pseudotamarii TaxID=132259 RepID=A0A5N6SDY7_ASPPS|nr:uncharacterized protein BDV38DRAFT_197697 [Aspergillus pseudotamarii]KAE8132928.1 hypothetical protein BDV38DRAFT_197697 [Aspergillus pseudotamarii]
MSGLFVLHLYRICVLDQGGLLNVPGGPCLNKMMVEPSAKKQYIDSQSEQVVWTIWRENPYLNTLFNRFFRQRGIFCIQVVGIPFHKKPRPKAETGRQKDDASGEARLLLARSDYYLSSILEPWHYAREIVLPSFFESMDAGGIRIGNVESLSNVLLSEDTLNGSAGHLSQ